MTQSNAQTQHVQTDTAPPRFAVLVYEYSGWGEQAVRKETFTAALGLAAMWLEVHENTAAAVLDLYTGDLVMRRKGFLPVTLELEGALDSEAGKVLENLDARYRAVIEKRHRETTRAMDNAMRRAAQSVVEPS